MEKYLPHAALVVAILGLVWTYFGAILNVKERLVRLETKIELFWKPLESFLTNAIHHPDTPILDYKLDNFANLTKNELEELKIEIREQIRTIQAKDKENPKILFYALLLARAEQKLHDMHVVNKSILKKVFGFVMGRPI